MKPYIQTGIYLQESTKEIIKPLFRSQEEFPLDITSKNWPQMITKTLNMVLQQMFRTGQLGHLPWIFLHIPVRVHVILVPKEISFTGATINLWQLGVFPLGITGKNCLRCS